jgi:hypothetical protein
VLRAGSSPRCHSEPFAAVIPSPSTALGVNSAKNPGRLRINSVEDLSAYGGIPYVYATPSGDGVATSIPLGKALPPQREGRASGRQSHPVGDPRQTCAPLAQAGKLRGVYPFVSLRASSERSLP